MTALDRALIKAYRAEQHVPPPMPSVFPEPCIDLSDRPAESASIRIHEAAKSYIGPHQPPIDRTTTTSSSTFDVHPCDKQASFRFDVAMSGQLPSVHLRAPQESQRMVPAEFRAPTSETSGFAQQPESVYLTARPSIAASPSDIAREQCKPQLIVDRFAWPLHWQTIQREANREIVDFVDRFVADLHTIRVVALVGADSGVGCTLTTLCLAQQLASRNFRPTIVDANFSRPFLADALAVRISRGWNAAVAGAAPLHDVLIESLEDHIVLAPLAGPAPVESLFSPPHRSQVVWRFFRDTADILLIDAGSADSDAGLAALVCLTELVPLDGVFVVCDVRSTPLYERIQVVRRLKAAGVQVLGVVENFTGQNLKFPVSNIDLADPKWPSKS